MWYENDATLMCLGDSLGLDDTVMETRRVPFARPIVRFGLRSSSIGASTLALSLSIRRPCG